MSTVSELRDTKSDDEKEVQSKQLDENELKAPNARTSRPTTGTTTTKTISCKAAAMERTGSSSPMRSYSLPRSYSPEDEESFLSPRREKSSHQKRKFQKLSPLPDLRFEQSYRNSIAGAETVGSIIAITIRDQVMVPLLQGTLWSLTLLGWAHWNRVAQVSGSSLGSKFKQWLYKTKDWKLENLRDHGYNVELAASVGDVSARWNGGEIWNFTD